MRQNLKQKFEEERSKNYKRKANHEDVFIESLYTELPLKKRSSLFKLKVAASIVILIGIGFTSYFLINPLINNAQNTMAYSLKNISPELKEIENFYTNSINKSLTEINQSDHKPDAVNRYMNRLSILKKEHKVLIKELNDEGPNSQSINVLIHNLKLQLELLQELKEQLNPVKKEINEII